MRLVDVSLPFKLVYAVYHHEYLGYLVSPHAVQILPNGELSLVHQGIHPESMEQFAGVMDEKDRELIHMTAEIMPRAIVKKFGGNPREDLAFFTQKFEGEVKKLINAYIQKRMGKILPRFNDRDIYVMGNDGYPAQKPIEFLDEKATVLFHFRKKETFTRYYPTIKRGGNKIQFQHQGAIMMCTDPAWMLLDDKLFTFEKPIDGKKLKPFLKKDFIAIPQSKEAEYYSKFVTQIIEQYPVFAKGFDILHIHDQPDFSLVVKEHDQSSFSFLRQVHYDRFSFPIHKKGNAKVILERNGDSYTFFRIRRNCQEEKKVLDFF